MSHLFRYNFSYVFHLSGNKVWWPEEISTVFYIINLCRVLRQNFNHQPRRSSHKAAILAYNAYIFSNSLSW